MPHLSGMKLGLQMQQKQTVAMTTSLLESIEMLQLSSLEIQDLVARELAENPCLDSEDRGENGASNDDMASLSTGKEGQGDLVEWDNAWDQWAVRDEGANGPIGGMYGEGMSRVAGPDDEEGAWEARATRDESLQEYLLRQYDEIVEEPRLRFVGRFLIDAIDDAGYLRANLTEVAARLKVSEEVVDDARAIIQTLEPAGVGASNLAECLRLQLHAKGQLDDIMEACLENLDKVAMKDWAALARMVNKARTAQGKHVLPCDEEEVELAVKEIQTCNPKPAVGFGESRVESVIPDVVVRKEEPNPEVPHAILKWVVELNGAAFPRLLAYPPAPTPGRMGEGLKPATTQAETNRRDEEKNFLKTRYTRAKWLITALEQRAKTTLAVARAVVERQIPFLDAGVEYLSPLTLKEVAESIGVHESTVSRAVSGKFMQTPWGVVPFKTFFSSGVNSTGGQVGVAATSVQAMISKMVKAENPQKPLSDEQIVGMLKNEGVSLARRTVAKYRGILGIPGTAERRMR